FDNDLSDNTASATVRVTEADLVVTKEGPDQAPPGSTVVYLVTVTNTGVGTAENVVLTEDLAGGSIAGYQAPGWVECSADTCDLGDLPPGASVSLWVVA